MFYPTKFFRGFFLIFLVFCVQDVQSQNIEEKMEEGSSSREASSGSITELESSLLSPVLLPASKVIIQGLDKITGRVFTIETSVGKSFNFGRLRILTHRCYKTAPEEMPESIAEIDIYEKMPHIDEERLIFKDKMYASSPAVSALDHPVYDIWVKDCF